jgi:2-polyprenyl-6-methoxyphenol hydroxylase-like FAD-dependent oxidoreductase
MPQSVAERLLIDHLALCGIRVERPYRLVSFDQDSSSVHVRLQHNDGSIEIVQARWLAGCDGAHSRVRQHLGIEFESMSREEHFLLAELRISWPLPADQFSIFLHSDGLLLAMPMPGGSHHVAIDVTGSESVFENADGDQFRALFSKRVPVAATLSDISWMLSKRSKRRHASEYRVDRVFIAGNAAHLHTPAAGQGTNAGIQDAINLAWKLDLVQKGKAHQSLLDSYSAERAPFARNVLTTTDRLLEAATLRNSTLQTLRRLALPLLTGFDLSQQEMLAGLSEICADYRKSPIVRGNGFFEGSAPQPGDQAPLLWRAEPNGSPDLLDSTVHNLLLFEGELESEEDVSMPQAIRRDFEAAYPGLVRGHVILGPKHTALAGTILDKDLRFHRAYGATKPCLFLIRPDSYVAFRSHLVDAVALHEFVRECYGFHAVHDNRGGASAPSESATGASL